MSSRQIHGEGIWPAPLLARRELVTSNSHGAGLRACAVPRRSEPSLPGEGQTLCRTECKAPDAAVGT